MNKFKLFGIVLTLALVLGAVSAEAGTPYKYFWIQVQDEYGDPRTDFTSVSVYTINTTSAATVYSSKIGGSKTNPILLAATSNGTANWYGDASTYDVLVTFTEQTVLFEDFSVYDHRIMCLDKTLPTGMTFSLVTDASSLTAASVVFSGGVAITKQLFIGDDIDMSVSGTGVYDITLKDAVADALSIVRGITDMIVFNTSTPLITITPALTVTGAITGSSTVSAATSFDPDAADGATLGTTALEFSDLYLADASIIYFGADQDVTLTHTADTGLTTNLAFTVTGALTANGGVVVGTVATGVSFTGTYTGNALDFSSATIDPTGSNGPCFIRAGTYASPIDYGADDDQSGMIRIYSTSAGTASYDRGIFAYTEVTSSKGAFPLAALAEANNTGTGPAALQAGQFIAHLGAQSTGAHLATLGGSSTAGMYGAWLKVAASGTAVCDSGSRVAAAWIDNQMSGTVSGEEYGLFNTTGASRPDAWAGFETTSSGYSQLFYFDETFNSAAGTCVTTDAVPGTQDARILVYYNGAQYYLALYR